MPEKKHRPAETRPDVETDISEIVVARNRSVEPYFHIFSVSPENVTQDPLGRIMGVFSVSDRSDSSAYVGNVIASVSRKEYYANTRRGVVESFEAALHRTNLALSELVKNGEIRFMGHLDGAMAVIDKGTIHFSTTGDASILLYRDGTLSDISEGLASEEAATHPMKTFVEISSGSLHPGDCVLLASPEIFSLFTPAELERDARRLVPERKFVRFLETAMVNELKGGVALVVTVVEGTAATTETVPKRAGRKKSAEKVPNVFGDKIWREAEEERARKALEADTEEPVREEGPVSEPDRERRDNAIYVDGETLPERDEHPFVTGLRWKLETFLDASGKLSGESGRAIRAGAERLVHSFSMRLENGSRALVGSGKRLFGKTVATGRHRIGILSRTAETSRKKREGGETNPILARALEVTGGSRAGSPSVVRSRDADRLPKNGFPTVAEAVLAAGGRLLENARDGSMRLFGSLAKRFLSMPKKRQLLTAMGGAFLMTLAVVAVRRMTIPDEPTEEDRPIVVVSEPDPGFPANDEPDAEPVTPEAIVDVPENDIVAPVYLNGSLFIVTRTGIIDTAAGKTADLPSDVPITLAAGMDDLSMLFLVTGTGEVFSFAPSNGSFAKNDIVLPEGFRPTGIGAFLTYLYLLNGDTGEIYRFPRAEGGFGEGTKWTAENPDTGTSSIAVNGNVYAVSPTGIHALFRGRPIEGFVPESPARPVSASSVCADKGMPDRFAVLDPAGNRVLLYAENGDLVRQYFSESFADAVSCAMTPRGDTVTDIVVASSGTVLRISPDRK